MSLWKTIAELAATAVIGGFVGYLASYLTAHPERVARDVLWKSGWEEASDDLSKSKAFEKEIEKAIVVAAAAGALSVRILLLVFFSV